MRPIKFRGKATCSNRWVYGCYVECDGGYYIVEKIGGDGVAKIQVDPETVGQFTGLTDKNGKEVYEGDIVQSKTDKGNVFWHSNYAQFQIDNSITDKFVMPQDEWCNYRVIGNIHENPELLEK